MRTDLQVRQVLALVAEEALEVVQAAEDTADEVVMEVAAVLEGDLAAEVATVDIVVLPVAEASRPEPSRRMPSPTTLHLEASAAN